MDINFAALRQVVQGLPVAFASALAAVGGNGGAAAVPPPPPPAPAAVQAPPPAATAAKRYHKASDGAYVCNRCTRPFSQHGWCAHAKSCFPK